MIDKNSWSKYIDATAGGDLNNAIAAKVRVDASTVGRWRTGAVDPKPRQVVDYARAYGQSPLAALIAAGYLNDDEIGLEVKVPTTSVRDLDEEVLANEWLRRIQSRKSAPTTPDVGGDADTDALEDVDLSEEFDLAATHDDSAIDPSRGEA